MTKRAAALSRPATVLDSLVDRLERTEALDKPVNAIQTAGRKLLTPEVATVASGTPIAHPLHPLLVALPIGAWSGAAVLDLTGGDARAARRLTGFGILSALPTAATGAVDWSTTGGAERRVGFVHAVANDLALTAYTMSWLARRRGRRGKGIAWSMIGGAALGVGGWLGGHLSYAMGVGVDNTAFERLPLEWTDACAESDVPAEGATSAVFDGVAVLLARHGGGIVALDDRCTHRGASLAEGTVHNGCVTCPLHGSTFALDDGSVRTGPASRPQPTLQVRVVDGRVQVRRPDDPRALRHPG